MTTKTVELAVKDGHGAWELIDDYATVAEAQEAAEEIAKLGQYHIDDHGVMVFGISDDPESGHYEETFNVAVETGVSLMYTEPQLESGEGLATDRAMKAYSYDGTHWQTCELSESVKGDPVEVVTVPPTSKGGWKCRA